MWCKTRTLWPPNFNHIECINFKSWEIWTRRRKKQTKYPLFNIQSTLIVLKHYLLWLLKHLSVLEHFWYKPDKFPLFILSRDKKEGCILCDATPILPLTIRLLCIYLFVWENYACNFLLRSMLPTNLFIISTTFYASEATSMHYFARPSCVKCVFIIKSRGVFLLLGVLISDEKLIRLEV